MSDKRKVLVVTDSPYASTGFGRVNKSILAELDKTGEFEFTLIAWNHFSPEVTLKSPYTIYAANMTDEVYGQKLFAQVLTQKEGEFEMVFTVADFELQNDFGKTIMEYKAKKPLKWIAYTPVDHTVVHEQQLKYFKLADYPVTYTKFGYDTICRVEPLLKGKLQYIYHGTDLEEFNYIEDRDEVAKFREEYFKVKPNEFLITSVNRNQWRKDLVRTMYAFKEFHKKASKSKLYMHCKYNDQMGNDLLVEAELMNVEDKSVVFTSPSFSTSKGVSQKTLNLIYNASDVVVSTSLGEGWGLSQTEAMATRTPVIMPRNTAHIEIVGAEEERGYLAECGTTMSEYVVSYGFSHSMRPVTNIESLMGKLKHVMKNPEEAAHKAEYAYEWIEKHTWVKIVEEKWLPIFRA